jgi:hypothetical protein
VNVGLLVNEVLSLVLGEGAVVRHLIGSVVGYAEL